MSDSSKDSSPKRRRRASKSSALRKAMMTAVTPQDVYEIVKLQVFLARRGDPFAVREVLDRTIGRAVTTVEAAALERREEQSSDESRGIIEAEVLAMLDSVSALPECGTERLLEAPEVPEMHRDAS